MIVSFRSKATELVWNGRYSPRLPRDIQSKALRKLRLLNEARKLSDLSAVPGNRLEFLKGDRLGQYSVRINDQWRVCFRWTSLGATNVEIVDYHS